MIIVSVVSFSMIFISGCATVPQKEFDSYVQAFNETKEASEQLILDLDAAKKHAEKIKVGRNPPAKKISPFPAKVNLEAFGSPSLDEIDARREALEVVSRFNTVLIQLAAGKKPEEIKSSVDSLIDGLNGIAGFLDTTLPIPDVASGLITTVIDQLQKAHNRMQFVAAMKKGTPIIDGILELLRRDAEDIYEIMARVAKQDSKGEKDTVFDLWLQMRTVAAEHKAPQGDEMKGGLSEVEQQLRKILDQVGLTVEQGFSNTLDTRGSTPFTAIALSQLQQTLAQAERAAVRYTAIVNQQNAYHQLVVSYGQLLWKTRQTLKIVRESLDRPADIRAQAIELIGFAFRVKRNLEAMNAAQLAVAGG
jgi:hypothetical protein